MATIATLAQEFKTEPYVVAAFADLGTMSQQVELDAETEEMIREAWAMAPTE